jgi:hypothetical protein
MPDQAPLVRELQATVPAAGAAVVQDQVIGEAPFDGTVTRVRLVPEAALVADNANKRTIRLLNKGAAGAGSTVVATYTTDVASGGLTAFDEKDVPLSGTAANLVVAAGDVLAVDETVAGTGVAHSGYKVVVELTRG